MSDIIGKGAVHTAERLSAEMSAVGGSPARGRSIAMSGYEIMSLIIQLILALTGVIALCYNIFKKK